MGNGHFPHCLPFYIAFCLISVTSRLKKKCIGNVGKVWAEMHRSGVTIDHFLGYVPISRADVLTTQELFNPRSSFKLASESHKLTSTSCPYPFSTQALLS